MEQLEFYYQGFRSLYEARPEPDGRIGIYHKGNFAYITFPEEEFKKLMSEGKIVKAHMEENDEAA